VTQYCKTCALLAQPNGICQITGRQVNPETDFCSEHRRTVENCDMCGRKFIPPGTITETENGTKITCASCTERFNTCFNCANASTTCLFEDKSFEPNIPPIVIKTIQQGNATLQTQMRNPERVAAVCPHCDCFVEGWGCGREAHTCERYKEKWDK
jgi:hypothetical protein